MKIQRKVYLTFDVRRLRSTDEPIRKLRLVHYQNHLHEHRHGYILVTNYTTQTGLRTGTTLNIQSANVIMLKQRSGGKGTLT